MNTDKRLSQAPRCFLSTASGTNEGSPLFSRKVAGSFPRARSPFRKMQPFARERAKISLSAHTFPRTARYLSLWHPFVAFTQQGITMVLCGKELWII